MDILTVHRGRDTRLDMLLAFIRDARFRHGVRCPRCGSARVHKWGTFSGRQRYRCRGDCGRTFSDLTATPAAYIKKLALWPEQARLMVDAAPLRSVSHRLDIHISTAFRWRHRMLAGLLDGDQEGLTGWIELWSEWFAESRKGERTLDRPARRRGRRYGQRRGPPNRRVLVASDRGSSVVTCLLDGSTLRARELTERLGPRIRAVDSARLTAREGPKGPCARFARTRGMEFREGRMGSSGCGVVEGRAHVRNAWAYGRRLRRWIARFRGVATRYLPNYLVWHRRIDAVHRHGIDVQSLCWPLGP